MPGGAGRPAHFADRQYVAGPNARTTRVTTTDRTARYPDLEGRTLALITLDDRSLGVMSPSKLHANLAAGLPILYVGPERSNVDEAIRRHDVGRSVRHGNVAAFVTAVRDLATDDAVSARARHAFESKDVEVGQPGARRRG